MKGKSKNEALLFEADIYLGFSKCRNKQFQNPDYLKNILSNNKKLNDFWKEGILTKLIKHYENIQTDSFEYYSYILEKNYPLSGYWNRRFALYLFEHKKDFETANRITNSYASHNKSDHWTPFLQGHSLASKGKKEEAFENFDNWMVKYSYLEDFKENKNKFYFFIDLAVFYQ